MASIATNRGGRRGPYAKSAERRLSIVEAAHEVFAARGYRAGSLQEVADRVGMSQTSLLHYFPSKSALLLAVLNRRDTITGDGSVPPAPDDTFDHTILRQAKYNESVPGVVELYSVLCGESTTVGHPGREYFIARFDKLRAGYADDFRALESTGRLRRGVDPEMAAASLIALWDGIQMQWLLSPDTIDMVGCLRAYLDLVMEPAE